MSTLQRNDGNNPPWTTTLIGEVSGTPVELSVDTLRQIANFDTLDEEEYQQVSEVFIRGDFKGEGWLEMLEELFEVSPYELSETMQLWVNSLKPLPRLVMKILTWNVVPRKSDKAKVRTGDIRPLYAIVTGALKFPFCQILMMNIWDSHESSKRTIIPHCRVLNKLLVRANVIRRNAKPRIVAAKPFDRAHLSRGEFAFKETVTHFVLHDTLNDRVQRFQKSDEERVGVERPQEEEREFEHYGIHEPGQPYPGHPPAYQHWDQYQRVMWDTTQQHWEEQRLRDREFEDRRARFEERTEERLTRMEGDITRIKQDVEVQGYYQQRYHHDLYDWTEQQRHHYDYTNQREYQLHAPRQDYATMRHPDGSGPSHPPPYYPEMNHPEWWPGAYRTHGGDASSSSQHNPEVQDPFDTRDLSRSLYDSIFGPDR